MEITLIVNGEQQKVEVDDHTPLLWVIRDDLDMTGTKYGCGKALCGACTVLVNGSAKRSCVTPAASVDGMRVTTIEGLDSRQAQAVKAAWKELDVPQCGFCQSGQIVSATHLLTVNPEPSDEDIDAGMSGNLCRCATYVRIKQAIKNAAKSMQG